MSENICIKGGVSYVKIFSNKAIKCMKIDLTYWLREYNALFLLSYYDHPNIIKYLDISLDKYTNSNKEAYYIQITLPKYEKTLSDVKIYRDKDLVQIFIDLLSAIKLCHKLNIWHRDIKLSNIMFDKNNKTVLLDFSHSAKIHNGISPDEEICTYTTRPPEVFLYKDYILNSSNDPSENANINDPSENANNKFGYNEKVDIWSIGMIMIDIIIGQSVFGLITANTAEGEVKDFLLNNANYKEILKKQYFKHRDKGFIWYDKYWNLIDNMLEKDPNNRLSASSLLDKIIVFALEKNINIKVPLYKKTKKSIHNKLRLNTVIKFLTDDQKKLFDILKNADLPIYANTIELVYDYQLIYGLVSQLIYLNVLNNSNKDIVVISTMLIVTVIMYDNIMDIEYVVKKIERQMNKKINRNELYKTMLALVKDHNTLLYIDGLF